MIYEIVNMSDAYTFEAPDRVIATTVVLLLGDGQYAARTEDQGWTGPVFAFGPREFLDRWYADHDTSLADVLEQRREELRVALASVVIGDFKERALYFEKLLAIKDPDKRKAFAEQWYDTKRTSINQIGKRSEDLAKLFAHPDILKDMGDIR